MYLSTDNFDLTQNFDFILTYKIYLDWLQSTRNQSWFTFGDTIKSWINFDLIDFCGPWLLLTAKNIPKGNVSCRGGVLEDVLGLEDVLEDTFWSLWFWPQSSSPWPRPRLLQVLDNVLFSARGQHCSLISGWKKIIKHKNFLNSGIGVARIFGYPDTCPKNTISNGRES